MYAAPALDDFNVDQTKRDIETRHERHNNGQVAPRRRADTGVEGLRSASETTRAHDSTHHSRRRHDSRETRTALPHPAPLWCSQAATDPITVAARRADGVRAASHSTWGLGGKTQRATPARALTPRRVGASPSPSLSQDGAAVGRAPAMVYESSSAEPARPTGRLCSLACRPRMPASIHANHSITPVPHSRVHPLAHLRTPAGGCEGSPT